MVRKIQTDRGSEFFAYQDGELKEEDLNQYDRKYYARSIYKRTKENQH